MRCLRRVVLPIVVLDDQFAAGTPQLQGWIGQDVAQTRTAERWSDATYRHLLRRAAGDNKSANRYPVPGFNPQPRRDIQRLSWRGRRCRCWGWRHCGRWGRAPAETRAIGRRRSCCRRDGGCRSRGRCHRWRHGGRRGRSRAGGAVGKSYVIHGVAAGAGSRSDIFEQNVVRGSIGERAQVNRAQTVKGLRICSAPDNSARSCRPPSHSARR